MHILMIAINDPAGTAIAFTKAINKYTDHTCRLITKEIRYNFMFEKDLHLPWLDVAGWDEVEQLLKTSDVFYFHMTADEFSELGKFKPVDYLRGKCVVHHHHGHPDFRAHPGKYRQKYKARRRRNLLVSTPDLLKLLPEARWQPNLVPVNDPLYTPLEGKKATPVIICHSPTRRDLKNTEEFLKSAGELQRKSPVPIEVRLIENTAHEECLRLKRESHILFDHLQGYYGVSSLEGLSQGLDVVAGLDEWNSRHIKEYFQTDSLPWLPCRHGGIGETLSRLIRTDDFQRCNADSREFMTNFWNERTLVARLVDRISGPGG